MPVFTDVDKSFWGEEAIIYLYEKGIINGFDDGCFRPNEYIKREQAVKMISVAFDIAESEYDCSFSDVNKSDWFAGFVAGALKENVVKGTDNNLFGVGKNITREDFAVMLYRIIGEEITEKSSFSDYNEISDYAKDAVSYMNKKYAQRQSLVFLKKNKKKFLTSFLVVMDVDLNIAVFRLELTILLNLGIAITKLKAITR